MPSSSPSSPSSLPLPLSLDPDDPTHRTTHIVGDCKPGSIRRIKLHNFLTYRDVEFCPGPRLNMVVGPNGTGKSSVLNAICLGLGGDPKLLGRADDVRVFIMHGESFGSIEIELAPKSDDGVGVGLVHVIRRDIDRNKGSDKGNGRGASQFYLNDMPCKIQDIRQLVHNTYGISIDNLCTFLPQDKVGSFSVFNAQQLLLETEKTLASSSSNDHTTSSGSSSVYHTHLSLMEAEVQYASGTGNVDTLQEELIQKQREMTRLTQEKQRMEERQQAQMEMILLAQKKVWFEFEILRSQGLELKELKNMLKNQLKTTKQIIQPLEQRVQRLARRKKECVDRQTGLDQKIMYHRSELDKQSTKFDSHDDAMEELMSQIRSMEATRSKAQTDYDHAVTRLSQIQTEMTQLPRHELLKKDVEIATRERQEAVKAFDQSKRDTRRHREDCAQLEERGKVLQEKLANLRDDGARRKERILRQQTNLAKITTWLDANRSRFRRPVHGPINCEVTPHTPQAAAYLEAHVPQWALKCFVVETKEDSDLLYQEIRNTRKIPINIVTVEGGGGSVGATTTLQRMYSDEKLKTLQREHGVVGYLDDTFTAHPTVVQALRNTAAVHKVLVGGPTTQHSIDHAQLLDFLAAPEPGQQGLQGAVIFVPNTGEQQQTSTKYQVSTSRYSNTSNTRMDDIGPARTLAAGVSEDVKQKVADDLRACHEELDAVRPRLAASDEELARLELAAQSATVRVRGYQERLASFDKFQQRLDKAAAGVEKTRQALAHSADTVAAQQMGRKLMKRVAMQIKALEEHASHNDDLITVTTAAAGCMVDRTTCQTLERRAREEFEDKKKEFHNLEQQAIKAANDFNAIRQKLAAKKAEADQIAPLTDEDGNDLPLKEELEKLEVSTLDEVELSIEEAQQKLQEIADNPGAWKQYERVKSEIADLEANLNDMAGQRTGLLEQITLKRNDWEHTLNECVLRVNELFASYMEQMGFTGEVVLVRGKADEDPNNVGDFKNWGIEIRVSFRDGTKAHVLSAQVQSGGERSVSTIMYLMALQDMMVAPFRCVDEINQGLDERNEKLVFQRIVANSTAPPKKDPFDHSGQYFLITPKLLPNLTEMECEGITVLFVINGPYNQLSSNKFVVEDLVANAAAARGNGQKAIMNVAATAKEADEGEEQGAENSENTHVPAKKQRRQIRA